MTIKHNMRELAYLFSDDQGRRYFEFVQSDMLPTERYLKMLEFSEFLSAGISNDNLKQLVEAAQDYMNTAISNINDKKKFINDATKVSAILQQLNYRRESIIPTDLFINVLCTMIVRDDEEPGVFNQKIHDEKCDFFIDHLHDYSFFFQSSAFRRLCSVQNISKENWKKVLTNSMEAQNQLNQSLKIYSLFKESLNRAKAL